MFSKNKPTLYLVRGVPGSGKSSLAMTLFNSGVVDCCFEADEGMMQDGVYVFNPALLPKVHAVCQSKTTSALLEGFNVAVSNTSVTEKEVKTYQCIAEQIGANFISLVVENRHGCTNIHGVPDEKINQMKSRFSVVL
jgi:predicted kinase